MFPRVLIGCPLRNSEKTLPHYLRALMDQSYPKDMVEFCFILNDCKDHSKEILTDFVLSHPEVDATVIEVEIPGPHYFRTTKDANVKSFARLAKIRNRLLGLFIKSNAEFLLSIDSDIIMSKRTYLPRLVQHNLPLVAGFIRNDYHMEELGKLKRAFNVLNWSEDHRMYRHCFFFKDGLNECDFTGAVILIRRDVIESGVRYDEINPGGQGEDQSFCEAAKSKGFKIYVDTQVKCYHAMTEKQREDLARGRFRFNTN